MFPFISIVLTTVLRKEWHHANLAKSSFNLEDENARCTRGNRFLVYDQDVYGGHFLIPSYITLRHETGK